MSESLPGYDEWKTTDPRDMEPEEPRPEPDPDWLREQALENKRLGVFDDIDDDDISF